MAAVVKSVALAGRPTTPDRVHEVLGRSMLVDGLDIVLDLTRSGGSYLVDAITGRRYLDMFTFVASSALGMNPPALVDDREFHAELMQAALNKPSNSDVYSVAIDWKSRHNQAHGIDPALGTQVLHLRGAFHGRSGYTLSLTNTKPTITARFPKFDWPRIDAPYMRPGLDEPAMAALEAEALRQARAAFETRPHDIACFVAEPIQGEGGDRHFRPEFFAAMRELCDEFDALLIFDEVQTGCGLTGTAWAYQQLDVAPDIVAFGKKTQVCGVMAGRRVDEVADNVFAVPSRLNSTWGGNLTDMVRARRILEVIEAEGLFERAVQHGKYLRARLDELAADFPAVVLDPRGRGLMCAFSLPTTADRDELIRQLWQRAVIVLPAGADTVRFRPPLTVSTAEIDAAIAAVRSALPVVT
ncbi:L-lysine 6-transaminase [Mycobacterium tuberculosis]|uniref:L-lysine 6-transaminase n=1 Tax=Mycobacterium tuberculosis TaxID=1773 RepID=UPI00070B0FE2|nr:L-lysine 6-transaminase [Mycobacterium tuberculosis]